MTTVLITGSSGFIGSALLPLLAAQGRPFRRLVRSTPAPGDGFWDPPRGVVQLPEGPIDAVVHLAAEPIADRRWTRARQRRLIDNRVATTELLCRVIARLSPRPACLLSASGIGYYGDRPGETLTESSGRGDSFLADVCEAWERATRPAEEAGIRVLHLRIGIVLGRAGGMLARVLTPFRLGLGGVLGSGRQCMSWITIDDAAAAIAHLLECSTPRGPVNLVSPNPVTNREFTGLLARTLRRPRLMRVPPALLRLMFGPIADEVLLASARIMPERLLAGGYRFRFPTLAQAMPHLLGRGQPSAAAHRS